MPPRSQGSSLLADRIPLAETFQGLFLDSCFAHRRGAPRSKAASAAGIANTQEPLWASACISPACVCISAKGASCCHLY
ncbi:Hypothetical predicted protein [Podarcis lilfordi]|uniref:Uncharacterized protein n=1 Tax=Podarcis lilfordi TaxID=74358 RepID=A0AA35L9U2_9SAUR|nr:Hypothetical predicted protein [Podarcis lilfordi]